MTGCSLSSCISETAEAFLHKCRHDAQSCRLHCRSAARLGLSRFLTLSALLSPLPRYPTLTPTGIKAVPRKLAYGIKAISELDEDKTKIVGDVAKPKAA